MRPIADLMIMLTQLTDISVCDIRKTQEDTPRVSILDLISAITGLESNNPSNVFTRLKAEFPEVAIN